MIQTDDTMVEFPVIACETDRIGLTEIQADEIQGSSRNYHRK